MNVFSFILRYSFSRFNRHLRSALKISLSFAFSMAILMIVLSVMQMLQDSRFTALRDVKSFDITVEDVSIEEIKSLYPDECVFRYKEGYALLNGEPFQVRYIDDDYDGGINILFGTGDSMLVPYSLYMRLSSPIQYSTVFREDGRSRVLNEEISPSGVYYTALSSEFDPYYVFMPYENAPGDLSEIVAIKGSSDTAPLSERGLGYETWMDKERTLYSAFALENFMMFLVLLILLIIVYVEILSEARTFLKNKRKERVELGIIGEKRGRIYFIFISSFLLILILGSAFSVIFQEFGVFIFSLLMRRYLGLYREIRIDYSLFFIINIVFLLITAFTVYILLRKSEKESVMEALHD